MDRDPDYRPAREAKTPARWPLYQPIPRPDPSAVRNLIERGRRTLADQRERRAWRELVP
jgi:hypothetical protein